MAASTSPGLGVFRAASANASRVMMATIAAGIPPAGVGNKDPQVVLVRPGEPVQVAAERVERGVMHAPGNLRPVRWRLREHQPLLEPGGRLHVVGQLRVAVHEGIVRPLQLAGPLADDLIQVVGPVGHEGPRGDDPDQLAIFDHGQVPDTEPLQTGNGLLPAGIRVDRVRVGGHPVADRGRPPVAVASADLAEEVALRENADQLVVGIGDEDRPNPAGVHQVRCPDGLVGREQLDPPSSAGGR